MSIRRWLTGPALVEKVKVHQTVGATVGLLKGESQLRPQCCQVDLRLVTVQAHQLAEAVMGVGVHPPHHHCQVLTLRIGVKWLNHH